MHPPFTVSKSTELHGGVAATLPGSRSNRRSVATAVIIPPGPALIAANANTSLVEPTYVLPGHHIVAAPRKKRKGHVNNVVVVVGGGDDGGGDAKRAANYFVPPTLKLVRRRQRVKYRNKLFDACICA